MSYNFKSVNYEDFASLVLNKSKKVILWTNPECSTTTNQPISWYSTTVTLNDDITKYDAFYITCCGWGVTSEPAWSSTLFHPVLNVELGLISPGYDNNRYCWNSRIFKITESNKIFFDRGARSGASSDYDWGRYTLIPYQVIGIKF